MMKKTRTNNTEHKCTYCGDIFLPGKSYLWQCSDQCRLLASVSIEKDCWINNCSKKRYGTFKYRNKVMGMHRASFIMFKSEIPNGLDLCHKCDNKKCCNPEHLFISTRAQNMQDCLNKGRFHRGERCYNVKLTKEKVIEIREMKENKPWMFYREIGEVYGLSWGCIYDICKRRTWKHIT
jgi:hypothetical protein